MTRNEKSPSLTIRNPAWRPAFERLTQSLARQTQRSREQADLARQKEQLTRIRSALFGCVPK